LKVVSNSGPLIALSKIQRIDILRKLFGEIFIPWQVHQEISNSKYSPVHLSENWIHICKLSAPIETMLAHELVEGEAASISLVKEIPADMLIIDERKGRMIARDFYKISITGTCGILLKAKKNLYIEKISPLLNTLKRKGYFISEVLTEEVLKAANEI
jgi:uncharacterized protein